MNSKLMTTLVQADPVTQAMPAWVQREAVPFAAQPIDFLAVDEEGQGGNIAHQGSSLYTVTWAACWASVTRGAGLTCPTFALQAHRAERAQ